MATSAAGVFFLELRQILLGIPTHGLGNHNGAIPERARGLKGRSIVAKRSSTESMRANLADCRLSSTADTAAATSDPRSTPNLASAESSVFAYASDAMRKETVKPMPQAIEAGNMSRTRGP